MASKIEWLNIASHEPLIPEENFAILQAKAMISVHTNLANIQTDMYSRQLKHCPLPPPPMKKVIGFGQFVWPTHSPPPPQHPLVSLLLARLASAC